MTDRREGGALARLRDEALSAGPYTRPIAPPGDALVALHVTDQPDPRRAHRSAVVAVNLGDAEVTLPASALLTRLGGDFSMPGDGPMLRPTDKLCLAAGEGEVFTAATSALPAERP